MRGVRLRPDAGDSPSTIIKISPGFYFKKKKFNQFFSLTSVSL
jgi:hypothetical protein